VGVEQHLMGLQKIGAQQEGPAVRQLDMGDLQLRALAAEHRIVLAPVELERLAGAESQRDEGSPARRLLLTLAIRPPPPRKSCHSTIGTREAERHEIGVHLLQRSALLA
jgi:hypothetical protein